MASVAPHHDIDYDIADLVLLRDAPKRWPVFSRHELEQAALSGDLPHVHKGRKRYVSEAHLKRWLKNKEQQASWQKEEGSSSSAASGSTGSKAPPISIDSGMSPDEEKYAAAVLRQQISKKPKRSSSKSSDKD